jgi:hypothetical protein
MKRSCSELVSTRRSTVLMLPLKDSLVITLSRALLDLVGPGANVIELFTAVSYDVS